MTLRDMWKIGAVILANVEAILLPETTKEVSSIMRAASEHNQIIVPLASATGLVGGGIPDSSSNAVILSLRKMNHVREINADNRPMVAEAGCILQNLHELTEEKGLYFPLNF